MAPDPAVAGDEGFVPPPDFVPLPPPPLPLALVQLPSANVCWVEVRVEAKLPASWLATDWTLWGTLETTASMSFLAPSPTLPIWDEMTPHRLAFSNSGFFFSRFLLERLVERDLACALHLLRALVEDVGEAAGGRGERVEVAVEPLDRLVELLELVADLLDDALDRGQVALDDHPGGGLGEDAHGQGRVQGQYLYWPERRTPDLRRDRIGM
ncbi:hypothetical protein ColKHC_01776 [Colletotrichum higginsianum]|nr:hypothetical protein ColKHC_01776 [Colletotrichum higginsianum]